MAEDIVVPKAPADWRPTRDQQQRIDSDPRLQRMSRDELYLMFKPPAPARAKKDDFKGAFKERAREKPSGGLLGGVMDRVTNAMRGN